MSLKAKVTIQYPPLTPLDRTRFDYSYDRIKPGTLAKPINTFKIDRLRIHDEHKACTVEVISK